MRLLLNRLLLNRILLNRLLLSRLLLNRLFSISSFLRRRNSELHNLRLSISQIPNSLIILLIFSPRLRKYYKTCFPKSGRRPGYRETAGINLVGPYYEPSGRADCLFAVTN